MRSVPGADRGPRAGSPRGVVDAPGSQSTRRATQAGRNPVATAPGTDLITRQPLSFSFSRSLTIFGFALPFEAFIT